MSREPGFARRLWERLRIKYRSSESIIDEYGHWQPPNEADAREHYWAQHAHHSVFDMATPAKDLKEFGEGVQMYFHLLRFSGVLFAILALLPGLPLAVFNGLGGWYERADLERTMLGNFGLLSYDGRSSGVNISSSSMKFSARSVSAEGAVTALFASTVGAPPAHVRGMDKRALLVAMSVLDLIGLVLFFAFSMFMIWYVRSRSRAAAAASTSVTLPDYSLRVGGLPPDTSAAALKDYIIQAAGEGTEVVRVELCRKMDQLLQLVVERGRGVPDLDLALAVVQRKAEVFPRVSEGFVVDLLYQRYLFAAVTDAIRQEQAAAKSNEVVSAFVTFATPESRRRALAALPRSLVRRWRTPKDKRFNNGGVGRAGQKPVALELEPAPEPSDLLYENLEYGPGERLVRVILSNLAKYLVLLVGFLLVSAATAMQMGVSSGSGSGPARSHCEAHCVYKDAAGNFALSAANRTIYKGCDPVAGTGALPSKLDCEWQSMCYECFCRAALPAGQYDEVLYCSRFGTVVELATLAQLCAVVGIVVANTLIEFAIGWLAAFERHHTRSREAVGIVRGLFITQFVSTAFSNLVANMYLPGPAAVISGSFLDGYIFTGAYSDTTPGWYHDVCRPIMISVFLTTLLIHAKIMFRWWVRRQRLAGRYSCLTQHQLNAAYEGHEFELAVKYGQHLYIIYVVMTYSSGMPLLYVLAAVHFITCYWSEKFELLRVCKRPLSYSRDLALYVTSTLPFAALWHLALGLWLFSLFGVPKSPLFSNAFRRSLRSSVQAFKDLMPVSSNLTPALVAWRFTQNSAGHLFIAFMACGGLIFVFFTLSTWLAAMRWLLTLLGLGLPRSPAGGGGLGGDTGDDEAAVARSATLPEFWVAVRSQLLVGPASYAVEHSPAYAHAFVRMEELEWEKREEMFAKAAAEAAAAAAAAQAAAAAAGAAHQGGGAGGLRESRRERTAASRLRAKQHAAKAAAAGWVYDPSFGLSYGFGGATGKSNKVAPAPDPDAGAEPAAAPGKSPLWDDPLQPPADQPQVLRVSPRNRPEGPEQALPPQGSRGQLQGGQFPGAPQEGVPQQPSGPQRVPGEEVGGMQSAPEAGGGGGGLQPQPSRAAPQPYQQQLQQGAQQLQGQASGQVYAQLDPRGPSRDQTGPGQAAPEPLPPAPSQAASQAGAGRRSWAAISPTNSGAPGNPAAAAPGPGYLASAPGPSYPTATVASWGPPPPPPPTQQVPPTAPPNPFAAARGSGTGAAAGAVAAGPPPPLLGPESSTRSSAGWERDRAPLPAGPTATAPLGGYPAAAAAGAGVRSSSTLATAASAPQAPSRAGMQSRWQGLG